jgi:hypothetical protein
MNGRYTFTMNGQHVWLSPTECRVVVDHRVHECNCDELAQFWIIKSHGSWFEVFCLIDFEDYRTGGEPLQPEGEVRELSPEEVVDRCLEWGLSVPPELQPLDAQRNLLAYVRRQNALWMGEDRWQKTVPREEADNVPGPDEWKDPPADLGEACPIVLKGEGNPIEVLGNPGPELTGGSYRCLAALVAAFPQGLTSDELGDRAQLEDPGNCLRMLRKNHSELDRVIVTPGHRWATRSRSVYRLQRPNETA